MAEIIQWVATIATVAAAFITAGNFGSRVTGLGFGVFLVGSLAWLATGMLEHQSALVWTNLVLSVLNLFGMWRWLGRQAKVEEGAKDAAQQSEQEPGATLFPVSLLTRAPVAAGGERLGHCVDAMADRDSGRVRYLVFSDGGVAGVGETLRRLDWSAADIDGESVTARLRGGVDSLPALERDHWPSR